MSNESMQKVYDAAQLFVQDTENIDGLRDALAAHDSEEKKPATRKPRAKATSDE